MFIAENASKETKIDTDTHIHTPTGRANDLSDDEQQNDSLVCIIIIDQKRLDDRMRQKVSLKKRVFAECHSVAVAVASAAAAAQQQREFKHRRDTRKKKTR